MELWNYVASVINKLGKDLTEEQKNEALIKVLINDGLWKYVEVEIESVIKGTTNAN